MKTFKISIPRQRVFDEVCLSSAYRAVRSREAVGADRELLAMREVDLRLAHWFFDDAVTRSLTYLRPFAHGLVNSDTLFEITLTTDFEWSADLPGTAALHLKTYMVQTLLSRWLEMVGANPESVQAQKCAAEEMASLVSALYYRPAPTRPTSPGGASHG